jgi:hypothetical protein
VGEHLGDEAGMAREELRREPRLGSLHRPACLEPRDAPGDRHAKHRRPGTLVLRLDRAHRLDERADPVFGTSEVHMSTMPLVHDGPPRIAEFAMKPARALAHAETRT